MMHGQTQIMVVDLWWKAIVVGILKYSEKNLS